MTTAREVRSLVAPLLSRHPEMVLVGRAIVLAPVHHLLRLITVDRTSSANVCQPCWGVSELWAKHEFWSLGHGDLLYGAGLWDLNRPELPRLLVEAVERDGLPKLEAINSISAYVAFAYPNEPHRQRYWLSYVRHLIALDELDQARAILETDEPAGRCVAQLDALGVGKRLMERGDDLGAGDRALLAGLLHEWEAYSVAKLKIGHLWERTPFPLEDGHE